MEISACIFDMDGTVVADEDEWGEAFRKVLERLGVEEKAKYPHVGGIGIRENWPIFIKKYDIKTDKSLDELARETKREYDKLIPEVELKEGFKEFAEGLKSEGIPTALATSSTWDTVEKIFDHLEIGHYFDSVTTGEEVRYKKPDPQIFAIAAGKLVVEPEECVVFEDSEAGVKAAHGAGMKVVALGRNKKHKKTLKEAELIVDNFKGLTVEKIEKIS